MDSGPEYITTEGQPNRGAISEAGHMPEVCKRVLQAEDTMSTCQALALRGVGEAVVLCQGLHLRCKLPLCWDLRIHCC